jgi:mannose-6-phosphate isomerase-like protein (cupin superfamily)
MHSHSNSEHVFFILEGELTIIDDQKNELTAHSGEALYIPAGEIHMAINRSSTETKYIAVTSPRL